jgi:cation-transporting ATPase 13A1
MQLKKEADVVCSEPGSLLTASTVTHVLFDKTGTLTADTQSLSHNIVVNGTNHEEAAAVELVLAGCHSLVELQKELVGDPLDLASLRYSKWALQKDGSFQNNDGTTLWQIKTFPFDANRKTSSSLVLVQGADNEACRLYNLIKGSPDVVQGLVSIDNNYFGDTVTQLGEEGYRVIAMGIQDVTNDTELVDKIFPTGLPTIANNATSTKSTIKKAKKVAQKALHRDSMEASGFDFCGFSCFEAVVRPSTPRIIKELQQAKMGVTMLTGDGVDAAVSVARRCQLISNTSEVAVLDWVDSKLSWKRLGETSDNVDEKPLSTRKIFAKNAESYALVATGSAVEALAGKEDLSREEKLVQSKLHTFGVFARASPSQKVLVASTFKQNDRKVLMCGKLTV